ncbi:MAG: sortase [bacterium]|nr:sortase [bacterium]MDE0215033.1 sortase [bacterium]
MRIARVLGALGKTVISIGLIILLFGIFQLWGTGVIEARAQQDLDSQFSDLLEESGDLRPPAPNPSVFAAPEPTAAPAPTPQPTAEPLAMDESDPVQTTPSPTPATEPQSTPAPEPAPDTAWLELLYPDWGSAVARIHIPSLEVSKTVVEGVRVSDLRKGPGHYPNTPLPGQAGNAAIAGHRTTYGAPFGQIDELVPGNQIFVETIQGRFVYQVVAQGDGHGHLIVAPSAIEVLDQDFSEHPNRLTLTACHPKGSARQRIIVVAELVGEPVPSYRQIGEEGQADMQLADEDAGETADPTETVAPTPTAIDGAMPEPTPVATEDAAAAPPPTPVDDATPTATPTPAPTPAAPANAPTPQTTSFGEGLDGDADAWAPAVVWGLAALAIWLFALFAGQRWKKLPAYALSALPFLVVLFMAFWHIDRILPSY